MLTHTPTEEDRPIEERIMAHWQEVIDDPNLASLPHKVETNQYQQVILTPPPGSKHSDMQLKVGTLLSVLAPEAGLEGRAGTEVAVLTPEGVRCPDVGWRTQAVADEIDRTEPSVSPGMPLIAVEILSPGNRDAEIVEKMHHYFAGASYDGEGAQEVWLVELNGTVHFFFSDDEGEIYEGEQSRLIPDFPATVTL